MKTATLRLFNAIQVTQKTPRNVPQATLERTIKNGYLLDPAIKISKALLDTIETIVGLSGEKANATFHKSWTIVQDTPMAELVIQQIIHYITTYGFEALGIYRQDTVYIPVEVLELPAIQDDIPLTVVKAMTAQEILDHIIKLGSGIALAQQTLDDIMTIVKTNKYDRAFVTEISNRELKALLYDFYSIVPTEPVEFLRHLVSKLTDESLLIKNDYLIDKIKEANGKFLDVLLKEAPDDLASIFFRFKPLFLAMKSISNNKTFFNQLRKKANKLHTPMPEDYLNSVTTQIKQGRLNLDVLRQRVETATIFRKIRLAYALKHRLHAGDSIVYRIRNGSGWATTFEWPSELADITQQAFIIVRDAIVRDVANTVSGQTIYIPPYTHYALPATEKQFTGHFPTGSYMTVPQDLIVGIHWFNTDRRVDLDLSVIGESGKIGWDAAYRSEDQATLFSGDVTDAPAPHGASELFYLKQSPQETRILAVNYYNFHKEAEVDGKILVAQEKPENFGKNYMVDISHMVATANIKITQKQTILGLITQVDGQNRVYFTNVSIGNSITSGNNEQSTYTRKYLVQRFINTIDFREILRLAGATVVEEKPEGTYHDLSPETLDKTTILNLINPS